MADTAPTSTSSSLFSKIWKWVLGGVATLVILFVVWKIRQQARKINLLEGEKTALKCQLDELELLHKEEASEDKSQALADQIAILKTQIGERDKKLAELHDAYLKNKQAVDRATSWQDIP